MIHSNLSTHVTCVRRKHELLRHGECRSIQDLDTFNNACSKLKSGKHGAQHVIRMEDDKVQATLYSMVRQFTAW